MRYFLVKVQCLLLGMLWLNFTAYSQETFVAAHKGETAITYKPGDQKIIVGGSNDYVNVSSPRCASHTTTTGGYTTAAWTTLQLPLPSGKTDSGDPALDYDANSNVYYCFTAFEREGPTPVRGGIYVCKSTNNGQSWGTPTYVHLPEFTGWHDDKPWMIVDRIRTPNRIYIAWTQLRSDGVGELLFSYSQDGGTTFLIDPIVLRSGSPALFSPVNHGAAMALDATGNLYVTWVENKVKAGEQYQDNASTIFVVKSTDGGASFLNISNPYVVKSGLIRHPERSWAAFVTTVSHLLLQVRRPAMCTSLGVNMKVEQRDECTLSGRPTAVKAG